MEYSKITVIDAIMGTGKTTWAENYMKSNPNENFVFITPYISETERIIKETGPERDFKTPHRTSANKGKLNNFNDLIHYGYDVASTHELFKRFDEKTKYELMSSSTAYTLIIDETLDVVAPIQIKPADIRLCIDKGLISIDEEGICKWAYDSDEYDGRFADIKQLAQTNSMICVKEKFFIWRLDPEIFQNSYFDKIIILTYLFDGSVMKTYFEYYEIPYEKMSIKNDKLVPFYEPDIAEISHLINLYEGPLNTSFEQKNSSLSATWYRDKGNEKNISRLKKNMDNYFRNIVKAPIGTILWSTFLAPGSSDGNVQTMLLEETRYDSQFLSCNVRGTNDYRERNSIAYMINVFLNPGVKHFFKQKNLHVNENAYALQYMLQWIWRSCIRDGRPINLYIPSARMHELIKKWMKNKQIPDRI